MIYSIAVIKLYVYIYIYTCRNIINNNDERTDFFRKIYLSHFMQKGCKRVVCERWVEDGIETATYWPQVSLTIAALLPHSAGLLNRGPKGLSVAPGYIIVWRSPASRGRRNCTDFNPFTGQGDIFDIFDRMHLFLDWRLGRGPICDRYTSTIVCYFMPKLSLLKNSSDTIEVSLFKGKSAFVGYLMLKPSL